MTEIARMLPDGARLLRLSVVGSRAHGLATPESDTDRMGVFALPTLEFAGLRPPKETLLMEAPDIALHEVGKALKLALKANPTVLEALVAPAEVEHPLMAELRALLPRLLSRDLVAAAYGGYAVSQLRMIESSHRVGSRRGSKHLRHAYRLLEFGERLLRTAEVPVAVRNPEFYRELAALGADDHDAAVADLRRSVALWDAGVGPRMAVSRLPEQPDLAAADDWLHRVRLAHLNN